MTRRGYISFVFDDGYEHVFRRVVPVLDGLQLPGVFALCLDPAIIERTTGARVTPWREWLPITARGHEVASHSATHVDLRTLAAATLDQHLRESQAKLTASTLIYPGGATNDAVKAAARRYYSAARTTRFGFEHPQPAQPLELRCVNFTRQNFSLWRANRLALQTYLTGRWLIETYHIIDDASSAKYSVPFTPWQRHMEFVARLPLTATTIRRMVQ